MPVGYGQGESATRLTRGLEARGRLPLELDTVVVPTVQLEDLSAAPFRRSGRRWYVGGRLAALAGNFGVFAIAGMQARNQPVVIDQIILGAGATVSFEIGFAAITQALVQVALSLETFVPGVSTGQAPVQLRGQTQGAIVPLTASGSLVASGQMAAGSTIIPLELVLPSDPSLAQGLIIQNTTVNSLIAVTVSGRWWDDHPMDVSD